VDGKGGLVENEIEAASADEAARDLSARGLTPVSINEKPSLPDLSRVFDPSVWQRSFFKVKNRELTLFFRQLAALFSAGVPLFESLQALEEQFGKEKLGKIITKLKEDVSGGSSFSGALAKHPYVFSDLMVAMVEAG
jgi:type IV pilus assembly protein PilC